MTTTDPYKNLEEQLRDAVARRAAAPAPELPRRRRFARWPRGGAVPVLIGAVVLGGSVATAAVVLAPGDRPQDQVQQALAAGTKATSTAPACRHVPAGRPRLVDDPVPAWVQKRLGVFRRAPTAADHVPLADLGLGGRAVLRRSVRVARTPDGWTYRLWLSRGVVGAGASAADPVACARVARDASLAAAAAFPPAVQAEVRRVVKHRYTLVADQASGRALTYSVSELDPSGNPRTGGAGPLGPAHVVPASGGLTTLSGGYHALYGIVPDGIATVRVVDASGSPRAKPIVSGVSDNVFHTTLPRRMGPRLIVEWRSASGRVVRRTHPHF
jgi:hypothetical protein